MPGLRDLMHSEQLTVAMVGTRSPTDAQLDHAQRTAQRVAQLGHYYVSGGAIGIDHATEMAYRAHAQVADPPRIWRADDVLTHDPTLRQVLRDALGHQWFEAIHRSSDLVMRLALRNVQIVNSCDLVLAWPGTRTSGTQQTMRIAAHLGRLVFDMNAFLRS